MFAGRPQAEVKAEQEEKARFYNLGFWYGTNCKKCHDVYPLFEHVGDPAAGRCKLVCEVCGRETGEHEMPWEAVEEWNTMKDDRTRQITLFEFQEERK